MRTAMSFVSCLYLFWVVIASRSVLASVQDFCIADYTTAESPSGFGCKDRSKVIAKDFVFSGLGGRANTSNLLKAGGTFAVYNTFPAVNGLGISLFRGDLEAGGVFPLHTHPRGTEIVYLVEGSLISGLITTDNKVLINTLNQGDVVVFPRGLSHFVYNLPTSNPATVLVAFNSHSPGIQSVPFNLFANDFPTDFMSANTFISPAEIKRLKALLGGTA